jgi:hypothetical protein
LKLSVPRAALVASLLLCAFPAAASAANVLSNGDFETGTTAGWRADSSTLSAVSPGRGGVGFAGRAVNGSATQFGLSASPFPVNRATVAGRVYTADGFVRSDTPGKQVCIRLTELSADGTQLATETECTASTTSFTAFPTLAYAATQSGGSLKYKVYGKAAAAGDSFEVDDLTLAVPDPTGPAAPTALRATNVAATRVDLSWTASSTPDASYRVYRGPALIGSATATSFSDTSVAANTQYTYTVTAVVATGEESSPSNAVTVTTPPGGTGGGLSAVADVTDMTNGRIYAMARLGNVLYVGGKFTRILDANGAVRYSVANVAAFDLTTGRGIPTWTPSVTGGTAPEVRAMAISADGATVFAGGKFTTVNGEPRKNFVGLGASSGVIDSRFNHTPANSVHVILATSSRIYFGGAFTLVDGKTRNRLAALLPNGLLDTTWLPAANDVVRSMLLAPDGGSLFIGGLFTAMNGAPRQSVARVTLDTGANDPWTIPPGTIAAPQVAWAMTATPSTLYVGFGTRPNYAAAFRLDAGALGAQRWRWSTIGNVEGVTLSPAGDRLVVSGHFGTNALQATVCGTNLRGLISLNPATGQPLCDWVPQLEPFGSNATGAWTVMTIGTRLWVGGYFTRIGGVLHQGIARFSY